MSTPSTTRIVGASVPRKEGVDKLLGRACYVDDIDRDGNPDTDEQYQAD